MPSCSEILTSKLKMSSLLQQLFGVLALLFLVGRLVNASHFGPDDQAWSNIIGGDTVQQENSLPMLVTININLTTKVELLGSGVIINKDWILTVGHLFNEFEEEYVGILVCLSCSSWPSYPLRDFANILVGHGSLDRAKQSLVKVNHTYSSYFNLTTRLGDIALLRVANIGQNIFADTSSLKVVIKDTTALGSEVKFLLPGYGSTNRSARRVPSQVCKVRFVGSKTHVLSNSEMNLRWRLCCALPILLNAGKSFLVTEMNTWLLTIRTCVFSAPIRRRAT